MLRLACALGTVLHGAVADPDVSWVATTEIALDDDAMSLLQVRVDKSSWESNEELGKRGRNGGGRGRKGGGRNRKGGGRNRKGAPPAPVDPVVGAPPAPVDPVVGAGADEAAAVGDPHLAQTTGSKADLCCQGGNCVPCATALVGTNSKLVSA